MTRGPGGVLAPPGLSAEELRQRAKARAITRAAMRTVRGEGVRTITHEPLVSHGAGLREEIEAFERVARLHRCDCGALMTGGQIQCTSPTCDRVPVRVPPPAEWPEYVIAHQVTVAFERLTSRFRQRDGTISDAGMVRLIEDNYRGTWQTWGGQRLLVPPPGIRPELTFAIAARCARGWWNDNDLGGL